MRINRVVATLSANRNKVTNSSNDGNPVNSDGSSV